MPETNVFMTGKIALFSLDRTDGVVGTGVLPVVSASINAKMDTPDASNFASAGYVTLVPGIQSVEISVEIAYDKIALPPIFAGMKADITLLPTGGRNTFTALPPTNTEATLAEYEYLEYTAEPSSFVLYNCTVTSVVYDVPVRDIQKVRLTLIPSATATYNWGSASADPLKF
jgi:hypothetical protein